MLKNCEVCGNEFEAKRSTAKYCSDACKLKGNRQRGDFIEVGKMPQESPVVPTKPLTKRDNQASADRLGIDLKEYERRLNGFIAMGIQEVAFLETGIPEWDRMIGGIPRGRVTEIYGREGAGKSTMVLNLLKNLGKEKVLYIDTEGTTDPHRLAEMGLDNDRLNYVAAEMVEDVYDQVVENKGQYAAIIVDSIANCSFRTEVEGEAGDANMGVKAKIMNKLMRVVATKLGDTALILVNQERMTMGGYTTQIYTPGGTGLRYAASLRVRLTYNQGSRFPKTAPFKGHEVGAEITKSKVCAPFQKFTFKLHYNLT